ncbi:MAG: hypothetical protein IH968_13660, partial [Gemmatimonadetes bacterium]|nr:hypothetical protein [Gemmatimonadota bacterium]
GLKWWGMFLLMITIGYGLGHRYFRALVWVVALVLLWRRPVSDYVQAVGESRRWEQWRSRQERTAGAGHPGQ